MQCFLVPVYHVQRIGRFLHVQSRMGAKLIFLNFDSCSSAVKLISNYPCSSISSNTEVANGITLWD